MPAKSLFKFLTLTLFCLTLAQPVFASDKDSNYFDKDGILYDSKYYKVLPGLMSVSLKRAPELEPGSFIMRIASPPVATGCVKVSTYEYEMKFQGPTLTIEIKSFTIDMRDLPLHPHYECSTKGKQPYTEIVFNKSQFVDNGTKYIKFKSPGGFDRYEVMLNDEFIQLIPDKRLNPKTIKHRPEEVSYVRNPLKYWFYPEGTVILSVPGADRNADIKGKVDALAKSLGMTPLEDKFADFKVPTRIAQNYYYVDSSKRFSGDEGKVEGKPVGAIEVDTVVFGLDADEPGKNVYPVYVRTPGTYE